MECFGIINQRTHSVNMQKVEKNEDVAKKLFYMRIIVIQEIVLYHSFDKSKFSNHLTKFGIFTNL